MTMTTYDEEERAVAEAVKQFPAEFGLRGHPGKRFFISRLSSYYYSDGVMLYVYVKTEGDPMAFCKGTPEELAIEFVP